MAYDVSPRWRSWFLLLLVKVVRISLSVWIPFHSCISSPMTQSGELIPSSVKARPERFFHLLQRQWDNYRHPKSGSLCCHSWFIEIIDWWKALKSTFSSSDCGWQRTARRPLVPVLLVRKVLAPHGACGTCCGTRGSWSPLWNDLLAFQLGPWVGKKNSQKFHILCSTDFDHLVWDASAGFVRSVNGLSIAAINDIILPSWWSNDKKCQCFQYAS